MKNWMEIGFKAKKREAKVGNLCSASLELADSLGYWMKYREFSVLCVSALCVSSLFLLENDCGFSCLSFVALLLLKKTKSFEH